VAGDTAGREGKSEEGMGAMLRQPIPENTFTKLHIRTVQCAKDGSFRIDQVNPGEYELIVENSTRWGAALRESRFKIPASDPNKREPLDLGVIEISLSSPSRSSQGK
jgi:hypothetical protein